MEFLTRYVTLTNLSNQTGLVFGLKILKPKLSTQLHMRNIFIHFVHTYEQCQKCNTINTI